MTVENNNNNNIDSVFLVIESGGEYQDAWERTVAVHVSEPAATKDIENRVKEAAELEAKMLQLFEWSKGYEAANPQPDRARRPGAHRQPWPAGLGKNDITEQMRIERAQQQRMEQKDFDGYVRLTLEWNTAAVQALNIERAKLGLGPDVAYRPYPSKETTTFAIEEHALIGGRIVPDTTN